MKFIIFASILILTLPACSDKKEKEKGSSLGAPKVEPPVSNNIPAGILSLKLNTEGDGEVTTTPEERAIQAISKFLRPTDSDAIGPVGRLKKIDERMAEQEARVLDSSVRQCLVDPLKTHILAGKLPAGNSLALQFQCMDNLDGGTGLSGEAQIAFGVSDTDFYLMERGGGHGIVVIAQAPKTGTKVDTFQLSVGNDTVHYVHIVGEDGVGLEFTSAAATGSAGGLGCGTHVKTNSTYIYATGYFDTSGECETETRTFCLNANDLSVIDTSTCIDAGLSSFSIPTLTVSAVSDSEEEAIKIVETPLTEYTLFSVEAEGEEE